MAIDCHESQGQASVQAQENPLKVYKCEGDGIKEKEEKSGMTGDVLKHNDDTWVVHFKGTATENKEGLSSVLSIITQPECDYNQEICPSSQKHQVYIPDSKQYSGLVESNEHIPNNVVNSTEGRPAPKVRVPRAKGKKTKRKRRDGDRKIERRRQNPKEENIRAPIPVQDDDFDSSAEFLPLGNTDNKNVFKSAKQLKTSYFELSTSNKDEKWDFQKLISRNQSIYHVQAGKLPPSMPEHNLLSSYHEALYTSKGLEISDCSKSGSFKFEGPIVESENHSVEECMLAAQRGCVTSGEKKNLILLGNAWKKEAEVIDNAEEGVLLTENLKPVDYEFKEGLHWKPCGEKLGTGSFGDVVSAKEERSGFMFAAKQIHTDRFRPEELTCCLGVSSPWLVPFYGAVREGHCITLLMMLMKGGSVGQLIKKMGYLPEDLALHYLWQVLSGLEHLHAANIIHGDIKADNVLLSEDGNEALLCDFGKSAHLPPGINEKPLVTDDYVPGTETHMAPEIVRGEPCGTKIDVWSACCMLLHMINGWQPWSRTHKAPLCLQIAKEPPPLQEIPPACHPSTRAVIVAGLEKDPTKRASASQLKEKVELALNHLGGLKSPRTTEYKTPRSYPCPPAETSKGQQPKPKLTTQKSRVMNSYYRKELGIDPPSPYGEKSSERDETPFELEVQELERGLIMDSFSQPIPFEDQQQMLLCLSEENMEPLHSLKNSAYTCDTGSSGIHSWNSQLDPPSFYSDCILKEGTTATPSWFNGIKVELQTPNGETLYILESVKKPLGDLAIGISSQIPLNSFTIVTPSGKPIAWDTEIAECGVHLQCALALDHGEGGWSWRVKRGKLEQGPSG
uniref:Protein kinase domain-containing protein n=1 Tax=Leptobrachium leishanense TaxID=445787 RepID=A0A8C5Q7S3_9ANUR